MKEWHVKFSKNTKLKNTSEKKIHFNEIIETPSDFEWMAYEVFLRDKKEVVIFPLGKKIRVLNDWMTNELFPGKK